PNDRTRVEFLAVGSEYDDIAEPAAAYLATEAEPKDLLPRLAALKDEALRDRLTMGLLKRPSLPATELARLLENEAATARKDAAWLIAGRTGSTDDEPSPLTDTDRAAFAPALAAAERRTAERWAKTFGDERDDEAAAWREILWAIRRVRATQSAAALREIVR